MTDRLHPQMRVYRIWYEGQDSNLAYIGESSNIASRLYNHEQTFGEDALFAYAERSELNYSQMRAEVDRIGAMPRRPQLKRLYAAWTSPCPLSTLLFRST